MGRLGQRIKLTVLGVVSALAGLSSLSAWAGELLFAQSAPLSGNAGQLGEQMRLGVRAAFQEVNRNGGVNGHRLRLISLDDAYEPQQAISNAETFVGQDDVIAMIGGVGTPTSMAIVDLLASAKMAYLAPMTGAGGLRDKKYPGVFNVRASYHAEVQQIVQWIATQKNGARLGILYQDDSYGQSGLTSLRQELAGRRELLVAAAPYMRNTTAVKGALLTLRDAAPDSVLIVGTYRAAAALIRWSRKIGFTPRFFNLSFVGSEALAAELGAAVQGIYVAQVMPSPSQQEQALVARYRRALIDFDGGVRPTYISLEGYVAGRVAAALAGQIDKVTRQSFYAAIAALPSLEIDGLRVPSNQVFLTMAQADGAFEPVN